MEENFENIIDIFDSYVFDEYIDKRIGHLQDKDTEYSKLVKKQKLLLDKFPNLYDILSEEVPTALTKEDSKGLIEYLQLENLIQDELNKELFMSGMREAHLLFNRIGLFDNKKK